MLQDGVHADQVLYLFFKEDKVLPALSSCCTSAVLLCSWIWMDNSRGFTVTGQGGFMTLPSAMESKLDVVKIIMGNAGTRSSRSNW
jgi:hypothetical protein